MNTIRQSKTLLAIFALLLIFGGCKGETPTAPPTGGGGNPPGGGTPPPTTGLQVTLTASNTNPLVDSSVTVTATVTQDGQPVPNGTAVEFTTNAGGFEGTAATAVIKTTTNGVATVTLSSSAAGRARVTAVVNNVQRSVEVTFEGRPAPPPPPVNSDPVIESVSPSVGRPAGGETIRITGRNFGGPIRVLFNTGTGQPVEAFVVAATSTTIDVVTPGVNVGAGQQVVADITVITQAGTANERRVERQDIFTFRAEQFTPRVSTATPNSGPVLGGTRVTIHGDGFQAPVQVLFGAAEARVISVAFDRIDVEAPAARDTSDNGSGAVTGSVDITVHNINSQTRTTLAGGFRYVSALQITAISPLVGASVGGTDVIIDGIGFTAPVEVTIAGVRADVLSVSATRLRVRTGPLASPCATGGGPVIVRNAVNGDADIFGDEPTEITFTYQAVSPRILSLSDIPAEGLVAGQTITGIVRDPGVGPLGTGEVTFLIGDRPVVTSPNRVTQGRGDQTFTFATPTNLDFPTVACTVDGQQGTQLGATVLAVTFRNLTTACFDTIPGAVRVRPNPTANPCVIPPPADVEQVVPIAPSCANAGVVVTAGTATGTATITFRNAGGRPLTITPNPPFTGDNPQDFRINPDPVTIAPGASASFPVTFDPQAVGLRRAVINFLTNDPDAIEQSINVCVQGSGS
jgi:hypothetical protein